MGFVERMRAKAAAERWVANVRFPGISVEAANGARKALVGTFVHGWESFSESPFDVKTEFESFSAKFLASLPEEGRNHPKLEQTLRGLEGAFRAGWSAAMTRTFGVVRL